MDPITSTILDAWALHGDRILANPLELQKRLARRRMKTLRRPLRAYCLAVRAGDTRMSPATEVMDPWKAADQRRPDSYGQHTVTLTSQTLRRLCAPIRIPPGADWKDVAPLLGCSK